MAARITELWRFCFLVVFFFQLVIYSPLPLMFSFSQNQIYFLLPSFPGHRTAGLLRRKARMAHAGPLNVWAHTALINLTQTFRPQFHGQEIYLVFPERKKKSHSQGRLSVSGGVCHTASNTVTHSHKSEWTYLLSFIKNEFPPWGRLADLC